MTVETFDGGDATMRKDDHQFFQDIYIASFGPLESGAKFDEEGTGQGWKTVGVIKANNTICRQPARWSHLSQLPGTREDSVSWV